MLAEFFLECFDRNLPRTFLSSLISNSNDSIDYTKLYHSNELLFNIAFRICWRTINHIYPTKLDFLLFLQTLASDQIKLSEVPSLTLAFCSKTTFAKHLNLSSVKESIVASMNNQIAHIFNSTKAVQSHLIEKFKDRFAMAAFIDQLPDPESTPPYTFYNCVLRLYKSSVIPDYCKYLNIDPKQLPRFTQDDDAYTTSHLIIQHASLLERNVLTKGLNLHTKQVLSDKAFDVLGVMCIDEAIRFCLNRDHYFIRAVYGASSVYLTPSALPEPATEFIEAFDEAVKNALTIYQEGSEAQILKVAEGLDMYCKHFRVIPNILYHIPPQNQSFYVLTGSLSSEELRFQPLAGSQSDNRIALTVPRETQEADLHAFWNSMSDSLKNQYDHWLYLYEDRFIPPLTLHNHKSIYIAPLPKKDTKQHPKTLENALFSKAMLKHVVKSSVSNRCPWKCYAKEQKKYRPQYNYLYVLNIIQWHILTNSQKRCFQLADHLASEPKHAVLLIDNRKSIMSVLCLLLTLSNLNLENWHPIVLTTPCAIDFYKSFLGDTSVHYWHHSKLKTNKFRIEDYTNLLKDPSLWGMLKQYQKVLTVQDDAAVIRQDFETQLTVVYDNYDYVGAPWALAPGNFELKEYANPELVGNGGLSLRSVSVMKAICDKYSQEHGEDLFHTLLQTDPEDVFFSRYVYRDGFALCPHRLAKFFSCEQILHDETVGIHKPWMYHPIDTLSAFLLKVFQLSVQFTV
jgi:hypothetical protein